ncbi:DUF4238 domain-containing protein [Cryobacterium sp. Sr8]|uniref:DUF4238 domain-containing protein n=1 Tax=Cryobacterium sp. Sr8 TaxID=1259203 RepID=UPI00141A6819
MPPQLKSEHDAQPQPIGGLRFKQRALITCDAPVTPVPYEASGPFMGVGMATARFVLYPTSRRTGLIMRHPLDGSDPDDDLDGLIERARSGSLDDESVGNAAVEKMMNERTAAQAVSGMVAIARFTAGSIRAVTDTAAPALIAAPSWRNRKTRNRRGAACSHHGAVSG